jgi:hypothetical protein
MNVLVIPEDFRNDQFVLQPLMRAMMRNVDASSPRVRVCQDPLLGGISEALKLSNLAAIVRRYRGMVDLFILCVDRDANEPRKGILNDLECRIVPFLDSNQFFLAENAWQEIEVWVLAGHDLPTDWRWVDMRAEPNPKERYFEPFAQSRGVSDGPGGGRKALADAAARRFDRICQLCSEDFAALRNRVSAYANS